jgi:manganese-dependent inorganic pyrophosphatase
VLPVTGPGGRVVGTVSLTHLGGAFIPRANEPRILRQVDASLSHIVRALKAHALHLHEPERRERLYVRLGTMALASFWKVSERENIPAPQSIIIVGDRRDIQQRAIEIGVRGVVITANLPVEPEIVALARQQGVNLIVSPYDSATTAWVVRTASTIERVIERGFVSVHPDARAAEVRGRLGAQSAPAFMVVDETQALRGILTKSDLLKPAPTRLVLVDHNEISQAVPGAEQVAITEIIDHHRLGPLHTAQPILFLNEPVGSTCTIVADLFRQARLTPAPEVAGLMMAGLISDTLHLNSPTTTPKDAEILAWLAPLAREDPAALAEAIFSSGSVILSNPPEKVVRSDTKIYEEAGQRFAVSQVEELSFANFWQHAKPLALALQELRTAEKLAFAALLITDINTQNSLLLVKAEPDLVQRISYAHVEKDEIFDLPGIVSRKKQLIPYLTGLLRESR